MPTITAVLDVGQFVDAAAAMKDSLIEIFHALDDSFRTMQKFETTLSTFSGSLGGARNDLNELLGIANNLGVSFEDAAAPFAKFASAAEGLSRSQVFGIFEGFATALSAVRANGQEVTGVFLALQQIVSKGKLSMEELRLQLAERIPGAMKLAAKAAGMNMSDFEDAVKKGMIDTNKWLLSFTDLLEQKFGDAAIYAAKTFDAEIQRMKNSLLIFNSELVRNSKSFETWTEIVRALTSDFISSDAVFRDLSTVLRDLSNIALDVYYALEPFGPLLGTLLVGSVSLLARLIAFLSGTVTAVTAAFYGFKAGILSVIREIKLLNPFVDETSESIISLTKDIDKSTQDMDKYLFRSAASFERMNKPFEYVQKNIEKVNTEVAKTSQVVAEESKKANDYAKQINDALIKDLAEQQKSQEDKKKVISEMYNEAGLGAEMYYTNEANDLIKQVSNWQKAGANINKSNEWLFSQLENLSKEAWEKGEEDAGRALDKLASMSNSLVSEFDVAQNKIDQTIADLSKNIEGLDGSKIDIQAHLDGTAVVTGIDSLIDKFNQMKAAAAAAAAANAAAAAANNPNTSYSNESGQSYEDFLNNLPDELKGGGSTTSSQRAGTVNNYFNNPMSKNDVEEAINRSNQRASRL